MRIFEVFTVEFGADTLAGPTYRAVPCRYGDPSRIAETIIMGNSENKVLSAPFITCFISEIDLAPERRQNPTHIESITVNERLYDVDTQSYADTKGQGYNVERYMPIPYNITMQVDVWTSNLDQKEQLMEQITTIFNPSLDLQTSNNPLDWSVLTVVSLKSINWSSRSIPIGTDNPIDVFTMLFDVPIWINPPAKIKQQHIIQEIIANVYQGEIIDDEAVWDSSEFLTRAITTPGEYSINLTYVEPGLYDISLTQNQDDDPRAWQNLFDLYGELKTYSNYQSNASQLQLNISGDINITSNNIVGWIDLNPTDLTKIQWHVDQQSLPTSTLPSINAIINPQVSGPGIGSLPPAASGQRYLLLNTISNTSVIWGTVSAEANDIIEYNGTNWSKSFDATASSSNYIQDVNGYSIGEANITQITQYVTNTFSNKMYVFSNNEWSELIQTSYKPGYWTLSL